MTSISALFKILTLVGLSLLAAVGNNGPAAEAPRGGGFVAEAATGQTGACLADSTTLCLNGSRFKVQVNWRVPAQGTSGVGTGIALTSDTGYFWFFSSNNIELVIKVVDGRGFNGKFWVFYGALSNVEYTITVTDMATGIARTYSNPFGDLASVADTAAFDGGGSLTGGNTNGETRGQSPESVVVDSGSEAACTAGPTTLCLNNGRFQVDVTWRVPAQGTTGPGMAVPLTGDTGEFWFFSSNNIELVLKVVDGTAFNGKFWVFYGALSNVEYTITVRDTQTGAVKTFFNPSGSLASVADTSGFDTAPTPTPTSPAPSPTPTPTQPSSVTRIVNVGPGNTFRDSVAGGSGTTVKVGDSVQWNFSSGPHSSTSGVCTESGGYYGDGGCNPSGFWDSGELSSGGTFKFKFTQAGSYPYYCTVHGYMMTGSVQVNP